MARTHLTDHLDHHAKNQATKLALVTDDRQLTWEELADESSKLAAVIATKLPSSQEQLVIGLLLPNGWQFVVSYLAILRLGHIAMPLDVSYKSLELEAVCRQIPPQLIISNREHSTKIDRRPEMLILEELQSSPPKSFSPLRLPANEQIASLLFTSGTTGQPKAAPYTHANHIWNIEVCSQVWNWNSDDTLLIWLLLSHWYGLVMGLSGALYHGNTLYLKDRASPKDILEELSSGKISIFTHMPAGYAKLLAVEDSKKYDLSKVRLCLSGASALPPAVWQQFKDRFAQEIIECYGSSESGRIASNLLDERIPGSPGRPLPGVEINLGVDNELMVRSAGIFPGYWHNPEATRKSLTRDGWWHTGDIAEIKDGRIILKGRIQEKIRRFGYSISARDIEWALYQNPNINDAYVLGVQQPGREDKLVYFLVSDLDQAAIEAYCKANLPYTWRPDKIVFLGSLPRTPNGKPQMTKLRDLAKAAK